MSRTPRWSRAWLGCVVGSAMLLGVSDLRAGDPVGGVADPCGPAIEDDAWAREVLSTRRPFALTDRDLFLTYERPEWADAAPPTTPHGPALDEQQTMAALGAFLERRFTCDPERALEGLRVYTDPVARRKVPQPTLRAALAALVGTVGEPGIPWVLSGAPLSTIHFGLYLEHRERLPDRLGGTYRYADGTVQAIIDGRQRFLPFGAFTGLLFHEILHLAADDEGAGLAEETIASSFEALVVMQTLLVDPSLALLPDDLTRGSNNHAALVRLNSGPLGSDRLTLYVPDSAVRIDPLAAEPLTEFAGYYEHWSAPDEPAFRELETVGNAPLRRALERVAEAGDEPPPDADFDSETLAFLDRNQGVLGPAELLRVACILRLDVPCQGPAE